MARPRPPLVYLPGIDGTGRLLHRQPGLDAAYDVHRIGYPQYQPATYDELAGLGIRVLERTGPGVLLAESFGGAVALTLALARPDLVTRLVLVNTFAYFPRRFSIDLSALAGLFFPPRPTFAVTRHIRGWLFFSSDIGRAERDEWWRLTADVPMSGYGWRLQLIRKLDLRPRLGEVRAPAVVIAAPDDAVVPAAAGRVLARGLPHARLVEVRVGHAGMIHPGLDVAKVLAGVGG
jgi:pimeloyl-ACP methyl ester carboxylesterase